MRKFVIAAGVLFGIALVASWLWAVVIVTVIEHFVKKFW